MAEAKQCDLCKNFYVENEANDKTNVFDMLDTKSYIFLSGKPKIPLTQLILKGNDIKGKYDVCDECGIKIKNFIKEICK